MGEHLRGGKRVVVSAQCRRLGTDVTEQHPDVKVCTNVSGVAVKAGDESAEIHNRRDVGGPHLPTCAQVEVGVEMDVKCALDHLGGRREDRCDAEREDV